MNGKGYCLEVGKEAGYKAIDSTFLQIVQQKSVSNQRTTPAGRAEFTSFCMIVTRIT
jgi:hypothetical protein